MLGCPEMQRSVSDARLRASTCAIPCTGKRCSGRLLDAPLCAGSRRSFQLFLFLRVSVFPTPLSRSLDLRAPHPKHAILDPETLRDAICVSRSRSQSYPLSPLNSGRGCSAILEEVEQGLQMFAGLLCWEGWRGDGGGSDGRWVLHASG